MLGPHVIALFIQLKDTGFFDNVRSVIDLENQTFDLGKNEHLLEHLYERFGVSAQADEGSRATRGMAGELYARLGLRYSFADPKGKKGGVDLDLNSGAVPEDHKGRYDLMTNLGTTARIINQTAAFGAIHELIRPGGFMLHVVPFMGYTDGGFFCYQPTFFESLARTNGYGEVGIWLNLGPNYPYLIPWERSLLKVVHVPTLSDSTLVALLQKQADAPFLVPYQRKYEFSRTPKSAAHYGYLIDGQVVHGEKGWVESHRKKLEVFPLEAIKAELERRQLTIEAKMKRPDMSETKKADLERAKLDVKKLLGQWKRDE